MMLDISVQLTIDLTTNLLILIGLKEEFPFVKHTFIIFSKIEKPMYWINYLQYLSNVGFEGSTIDKTATVVVVCSSLVDIVYV